MKKMKKMNKRVSKRVKEGVVPDVEKEDIETIQKKLMERNWEYTLEIAIQDIMDKEEVTESDVQAAANAVMKAIEKFKKENPDCPFIDKLEDVGSTFELVGTDEEEFDAVMNDLYDLADDVSLFVKLVAGEDSSSSDASDLEEEGDDFDDDVDDIDDVDDEDFDVDKDEDELAESKKVIEIPNENIFKDLMEHFF